MDNEVEDVLFKYRDEINEYMEYIYNEQPSANFTNIDTSYILIDDEYFFNKATYCDREDNQKVFLLKAKIIQDSDLFNREFEGESFSEKIINKYMPQLIKKENDIINDGDIIKFENNIFINCDLNNFFALKNLEISFKKCVFINDKKTNFSINFLNLKKLTIKDCSFTNNTSLMIFKSEINDLCIENSSLNLEVIDNIHYKGIISLENKVSISIDKKSYLNHLIIDNYNISFNEMFKTNNIKQIKIINSIIENEFNSEDVNYKNINLENSLFKEEVSFKGSSFEENANFEKTKFNNLVSFENATFKKEPNFTYTTFLDQTIFRKTKFEEGLNLAYINLSNSGNLSFLKADITEKEIEIPRKIPSDDLKKLEDKKETYRIIKNEFQKKNDQINALENYKKECEFHRKSIKLLDDPSDFFILYFEKYVSNYGNSALTTLGWILSINYIFSMNLISLNLVIIITSLLRIIEESLHKLIFTIMIISITYTYLFVDSNFLNVLAQNLNPISYLKGKDINILDWIHLGINIALYYELQKSLRKYSRKL